MTRERKIFAAVLVLAAGALAVDRMISGPSAAEAADTASLLISPAEREIPPQVVAELWGHEIGVAGASEVALRLTELKARLGPGAGLIDAFEPGPQWGIAATGNVHLEAAQQAFEKHKLTSLINTGRGGAAAMIDGNYLRIGQAIEGYKLVSVETQAAWFEGQGARVRVAINAPIQVTGLDAHPGAPLSAP